MTECTAHVQMPDAPIGGMFQTMVLEVGAVTFSSVRSAGGTWLSFGVAAHSDDEALQMVSTTRYAVSHMKPGLHVAVPHGYDAEVVSLFESAPLIVTSGRTVIHSEGV